ncbi:unnamed protein product [Parnassius apollo]|uniref:(apollo) hypothetical protein n=1 Tax=Parnassius apollo TaxID=110799 RepID=A0A8S3WJQ4_PARAO|nr:unnamed protein product [Parnassius apollo]
MSLGEAAVPIISSMRIVLNTRHWFITASRSILGSPNYQGKSLMLGLPVERHTRLGANSSIFSTTDTLSGNLSTNSLTKRTRKAEHRCFTSLALSAETVFFASKSLNFSPKSIESSGSSEFSNGAPAFSNARLTAAISASWSIDTEAFSDRL